MRFFDSMLNAFLSREQRERHSRNKWDKSVAQAARDLGLDEHNTPRYVPTTPAPSCPPSPKMRTLKLNTSSDVLTSFPMTPSLSSASSSSTTSGINSPTRSRPSTSYSTSPRPGIRRHTSLNRNPISYDALMTKTEKLRRSSTEAAPHSHQLLYPLPPLEPMQGIGKYRRAITCTDEYLATIEHNTITALQPFVAEDDRVSRFRRGENKDTTTPPRAYSTSPKAEDIARRQLAMQHDLERWTAELEAASEEEEDLERARSGFGDQSQRQSSSGGEISRRPVRVAAKRRAHNSRERTTRGVRRGPQQVSGLTRNLRHKGGYRSKAAPPAARDSALSASMETLVSGEE